MSDWWGTPDTATEEGSGLSGFFTGDSGQDFGERLGMLGEIWSRIGSGQGLQGISGQMGAMNERSGKRQERSRRQKMAYRLADKLEKNNPQLAEMIRSDPEFGLNLVGKQMEAQQMSKLKIAEFKNMTPFEIERAKQIALAEGDIEIAKAAAKAKAEAELRANSPSGIFARKMMERAEAAAGGGGSVMPAPVAGYTSQPPSGGTQPPAPIPGAGTLGDMGGGGQPGAGTVPQTQPAPGPGPGAQLPPDNPLNDVVWSPDKLTANLQREFTLSWGVPVSAMDIQAYMDAISRADGTAETIMNNIQTRYASVKQERERVRNERAKVIDERNWAQGERLRNEETFKSELTPFEPATGQMGPMPRGTAQPGIDPQNYSILDRYKINPTSLQNPNLAAQEIFEGARKGDVGGPLSRIRTDVDKNLAARAGVVAQHKVEVGRDAVLDPLIADKNTLPVDREAMLMMKQVTDPEKLAEYKLKLTEIGAKRLVDATTAFNEDRRIDLLENEDVRKTEAFEKEKAETKRVEATRKARTDARNVSFANDVVSVIKLAHKKGNTFAPVGGWTPLTQWMPDTDTWALADSLNNLAARVGVGELAAGRQMNKTGGADVPNPTEKEWERLGQVYTEVQAAQAKDLPVFTQKMKTLYNMKLDVEFGVGVGPPRMIVDQLEEIKYVSPEEAIPTYPEEAAFLANEQANAPLPEPGEQGPTKEEILEEMRKRVGGNGG